jgi:hypothetical protein
VKKPEAENLVLLSLFSPREGNEFDMIAPLLLRIQWAANSDYRCPEDQGYM